MQLRFGIRVFTCAACACQRSQILIVSSTLYLKPVANWKESDFDNYYQGYASNKGLSYGNKFMK